MPQAAPLQVARYVVRARTMRVPPDEPGQPILSLEGAIAAVASVGPVTEALGEVFAHLRYARERGQRPYHVLASVGVEVELLATWIEAIWRLEEISTQMKRALEAREAARAAR
jgi:hypothetical protein